MPILCRLEAHAAFQLRAQNFFECGLIGGECAKIDMVMPLDVFGYVLNLHLQLRLTDLPVGAAILQFG